MSAQDMLGKLIETKKDQPELAKRALAHFNKQADIFTRCQACKAHLSGTLEQVLAHRCDFLDLIGAPQ